MKLAAGTRVRYRDWKEPDDAPMNHSGVVKVWGFKWITLTDDATGKESWAKPDGAVPFEEKPEEQKEQPAPVVQSVSISMAPGTRLSSGTRVRYRDWREPADAPMTHTGTVKTWGTKWITITDDITGKDAWSNPDGAVVEGATIPGEPPAPLTYLHPSFRFEERVRDQMKKHGSTREEAEALVKKVIEEKEIPYDDPSLHNPVDTSSIPQQPREEMSEKGLLFSGLQKGTVVQYYLTEKSGLYSGKFLAYEKGGFVHIETIPAYGHERGAHIRLRDNLVSVWIPPTTR